jgi:hypothetical protein
MERTAHGRNRFVFWSALAFAVAVTFLHVPYAPAQSQTTGGIAGVVTDPTGAVVPHATVTATQLGTGAERSVKTQTDGTYSLGLLEPSQYSVMVTASGFRTAEQGPITVALSATTSLNIKLEVGQASQTVEVSGAAPLIETSNPNTTTNVTNTQLASLPNPGNDLSYVAQVAPGAVMNTSGGYGNMEFNGLPATSTNFSIDGMDANDPFLNLNNSGATNLQLGLNAVQEASVNTLSFSVDQGRQGAAQVDFISKSGTNQIHGNLFETWNGSVMNGVNWFTNAQPTGQTAARPFSNVNQFGGSIGGPILHNKLFYFFDMEGIRIVVPATKTEDYPSPAYESYALAAIPTGGYDPSSQLSYAPPPNPSVAVSQYQKEFALYGTPSGGSPISTSDCPLGNDPTTGLPAGPLAVGSPTPHGDGCRFARTFGISNLTHDLYWKARVDHDINANNRIWYSANWEKGVQATYTDAVNPVFDAFSTQPQNGAAVGWTHIFGPNLVNDFNPGYYWYSAIFSNNSLTAAKAASPYEFTGGSFSPIYGDARDWPQGRNVTNYQVLDNLTWTRGSHEFKFGENIRRTLVSDHDTGINSGQYLNMGDLATYAYDVVGTLAQQGFPTSTSEPIGLMAFDAYAMDTWKVRPNLTVTLGVRGTWNGDPKSQHSNFSELKNSDFFNISHDVTQPLNSVINPHNALLAYSTPLIDWQPRASFAWSVRPNTVIRAGGGIFSDIFPASVADGLLANTPNDNIFQGGALSTGLPIKAYYAVPGSGNGVPGSLQNDALGNIASAQAVSATGFANGLTSCYVTGLAPPNCLSPGTFTALPKGEFKYPYFAEWSFGIEQQFSNNWAAKISYVGTRAIDLPFAEQANGFQTACAGCFNPYIYDSTFNGPDGRFAGVTQNQYGAGSIYHALQASLQKRTSHGLTLNLNYTYSHCIDTLSNEGSLTGGFDPATSVTSVSPGELGLNRGNCDYDIRNVLNGSYIYQLPSLVHCNRILGGIVNGWQVSGDLFLHSGFPFSVVSSGYAAGGQGVFQGSDPNYAIPTGANAYAKFAHSSTQSPGVPEIQWLNPSAFTSVVDPSTGSCTAGETIVGGSVTATNDTAATCQYARGGRNNVFGPPFKWTDLFVSKNFKITERVNFRIDGQFYNLFNHANYALPGGGAAPVAGVPSNPGTLADAFTITGTANPPTGLLGSGLGGDSSVRIIALAGRLTF